MILVIDNYDSFTYNLVHYLNELGAETVVYRNDALTVQEALGLHPAAVLLSPGPKAPDQAGICLPLLRGAPDDLAILGVCLGHQAIGQAYGGEVIRAKQVMHGKVSKVRHNDKGIFKAVFVMGIPGSGKSYTVDKIAGSIMPRIVNTDSSLEFLVKKYGDDYKNVWEKHGPKTEKMTQGKLKRALDGALPLMLENTSASASSILLRMGLLESLGYDIAMVYVNTDLGVALDRANKRDRVVDADFIKRAHNKIEKDVEFLKPKFSKFMEIKNSDGELTDDVLMKAYKAMQHFYSAPVQNPIGKRNMESMKAGNGYMVDSVLEEDELSSMVSSWYTT